MNDERNSSLKLQDYIVASVDILGAKELIRTADKGLERVHSLFSMVIEEAKTLKIHDNTELKYKIFSDNIIIALKPTHTWLRDDINTVIRFVALMQWNFAISGILVRGAITIGEFYMSDVMVWGQAVVQTHLMESRQAIYPRIIIDKKLITDQNLYKSSYIIDNDGCPYINFLCILDGFIWTDDSFEKECATLQTRIKDDADPYCQQKINWFKNYVNCFMKSKENNNG